MNDQEILKCLCDSDRQGRERVLRQLRSEVQQMPGKLPFHDVRQIFRGLSSALEDSSWEVPYQCLKFISEIVSLLGDDTEIVNLILRKALTFLGSERIALCDCSFELVSAYASQLNYSESFWTSIVKYGLCDAGASAKRVLISKIMPLLNKMHISSNCVGLRPLVTSLIRLAVNEERLDLHDVTMNALAKCLQIVGATAFHDYLNVLPKKLQMDFQNLVVGKFRHEVVVKSESYDVISGNSNNLELSVLGRRHSGKLNTLRTTVTEDTKLDDDVLKSKSLLRDENIEEYLFGFVPEKLWMQLSESSDWRTQDDAICELKQRLLSLNKIDSLLPKLDNFLHGLRRFLDDSGNFSPWMIITTLDILEILVRKLGFDLQKFLRTISTAILKQLSRHPMRVQRLIDQVMRKMSPKSALEILCDNLCEVHDSAQRETLDAIVTALLSHPNETFDFKTIITRVVPMLISSKREVRQAALECIAVLFRILGPSRVQKLLAEIDLLDKRVRAKGMKAAVLARLARNQAPVIGSSGKLVYVTRVPSGNTKWNNSSSTSQYAADIHWILFGPGMEVSESDPSSVVWPGSKCCCISSAPPEICSDELSKHMIGRTPSKLTEQLVAVESEGFEPSFEDDQPLARQKVHSRAALIYSGRSKGMQMPDLGLMTFSSSPPSDLVESGSAVSDNPEEAESSPNNISDGEVSRLTLQFPEMQNQAARTSLSSAGSKQVMSGSPANGQMRLKRKDLILPYMSKTPKELSKDAFTSLGNSVMGCNSSKSTYQIEQVNDLEDSQSVTTPHVYDQQLYTQVQHNPPKALRKSASSQARVNPEYSSLMSNGTAAIAACEDSENEKSKTESVKTFPGRQKTKYRLTENNSKADLFYNEEEEDEDLGPFPNPTAALNEALGFLSQSDWQKICLGLRIVRHLAYHHPEDVCPLLLTVNEKVTQQVKNLRSKVCISAIVCLKGLFKCLQKNMDTDLDRVVPTLLLKSAETNHFIRETAEQSLVAMLENTTPLRAANSLINAGASHRNITIRIVTARMIKRLVEMIGPETVFSGNEDLAGRILAIAVCFLNDGSADVRYLAQKILYALMFHANFNKFMKKIDDRQILQKIDILRRKGPKENGFRSSKS